MSSAEDKSLVVGSTGGGIELADLSSSSTIGGSSSSQLIGDAASAPVSTAVNVGVPLYDDYMCRICLEEGRREDFIAPCSCAGSARWVHRHCLDKWRSMREDRAFSQCTECLAAYELQCITSKTRADGGTEEDSDDDEETGRGLVSRRKTSLCCSQCYSTECKRRTRFIALVSRDLLLLFLVVLLVIGLATLIAMLSDLSLHHYFVHMMHMEDRVVLCYLFLGLFLFFAYIGLHYACVYLQCCGPCNNASDGRFYTCDCCNDTIFLPYYMTPDMPPTCCCVECGNAGSGCACECCGSATSSSAGAGASATGCDCCGGACCECSTVEMGHELIVFFFAIMIVLAVIGVFISIFVGVVILQSIISRHIHVLRKWNLTKEYIVKDLAPGAIEVHSMLELETMQRKLLQGEDSDADSVDSLPGHSRLDSTTHGVDNGHTSDTEWNPSMSNTLSSLVSRRGGNRHGSYSLVAQDHVDETTRLHNSTTRLSPTVMDDQTRHYPGEGLTTSQRQVLERMGLL